jgi:hypothetical protein
MRAILLLAILVPALSACSNAAAGDSGANSGRNQVFPFTTPQPA